ncbi:MAG: S46 family peptidase [Zavarzinella sp.]|nr:S46 family peptidase [Zavarzinella sp.]
MGTRLAFLILGTVLMPAYSDEGMWLLNDPPRERLKEKYGFDLSDEWLEHARLASVRFNNGGSGSFVSPNGLLVTNHHIASDALQKLSTPDRDLFRDGFCAKTPAEELKCPDLELNVLQSIEDITDRVNAAVKPEMKPADAFAARRAAMSAIEKESFDKTGLRSDVVTLYQGGAYHLYRYKKYTDVRLVFAPEEQIASFGGDVDNFEFPRFGLDVSFFRAYEDGQPVQVKHWFRWSPEGAKDGELVFVTGHPGTTNRLETLDKLQHRRDITLPFTLARIRAMEAALTQFGERGPESKRRATTDLHRYANARKAFSGQYQGLLDPKVLAMKAEREEGLFPVQRAPGSAPLQKSYDAAVRHVAEIQRVYATFERPHNLIETSTAFPTQLFTIARHIVRLTAEVQKPNGERLREYRDSNLDSLKLELFSPAPIYPDLERTKLITGLTFLAEQLGGEHPLVLKALDGKSPGQRADELIARTKLFDPAERKRLVEGGVKAVEASDDPMIVFARLMDPAARELRKRFETEVEEPERQAYAELAKVRFAVLGRSVPPDATFTLRLAYGVVKGYDAEGQQVPYATTFAGLYERAEKQQYKEPFTLPKRWLDGKGKLDLATPFNFVSTADTIGGNSGSPVLNRAGEFVGINFDRNRFGLVRNFVYTDVQARHIAVHAKGILEALRKLYDCPALVKELTGG